MKQHITIEQLKESSFEQYKTLVMYYVKYKPENFEQDIKSNYRGLKSYGVHWLTEKITIGKMIEILGERLKSIYFSNSDKEYYVSIRALDENDVFYDTLIKEFEDKELCNALWNAVKLVLEGNFKRYIKRDELKIDVL